MWNDLYFYHDKDLSDTTNAFISSDDKFSSKILFTSINIPYDTFDIDNAIMDKVQEIDTEDNMKDKIDMLAKSARITNNLYRLLLAEFSMVINNNKDTIIRGKLLSLISSLNFDNPNDLSKLRKSLVDILEHYPDDLQTIRELVSKLYLKSDIKLVDLGEKITMIIKETRFKFDNILLDNLRESHNIIEELKKLLDPHVDFVSESELKLSENIYTACSDKSDISQSHCHDFKLKITREKYIEYLDLLKNDIINTSKSVILPSLTSGVFNPLNFIYRPGEKIDITI